MNKLLLSFVALYCLKTGAQTITDTVSLGAGYSNQKWYSLQNDEQGTSQNKDNWDIAFEITGFSGAILANTQKSNLQVYKAPYKISDFASIDTSGITNWSKLNNSDTTWAIGAFNKGGSFSNSYYLGWGLYDVNTHIVNGDSCYVIKLSAATYKKIKFNTLAGGIYNFTYSDLNGANAQTVSLNKANYTGKNFAYYNLTTNTALDREPASNSWDLTFGRYVSLIQPGNTPYAVVGVLQNKGVLAAQADNVISPQTYVNWQGQPFVTAHSVIGSDWKTFDLAANAWRLAGDTVYFVKSKSGAIWKLRFTGFGGSANGSIIFTKEMLSAVSVAEQQSSYLTGFTLYPNPCQSYLNVLLASDQHPAITIEVADITGKVWHSADVKMNATLINERVDVTGLSPGVYLVKVTSDKAISVRRFIKQ